jgi:hypothetical protein
MFDYINLALRTAAGQIHPVNMQILHSAIGMVTETVEMDCAQDEENYLEEMGDTMWYVAIGCNELSVTLDEAEATGDPSKSPVVIAADFLDLMKKAIYYGKQPDPKQQVFLLGSMIASLREDALASGSTLERVMEQNIAKLGLRYPDKFTAERAINR